MPLLDLADTSLWTLDMEYAAPTLYRTPSMESGMPPIEQNTKTTLP